jgi:hypothetical membrane protein
MRVATSQVLRAPFRYFSLALGVITLGSLFPASVLLEPVLGYGGVERLIAYPIVVWAVSFGTYAMAGGLDRAPR